METENGLESNRLNNRQSRLKSAIDNGQFTSFENWCEFEHCVTVHSIGFWFNRDLMNLTLWSSASSSLWALSRFSEFQLCEFGSVSFALRVLQVRLNEFCFASSVNSADALSLPGGELADSDGRGKTKFRFFFFKFQICSPANLVTWSYLIAAIAFDNQHRLSNTTARCFASSSLSLSDSRTEVAFRQLPALSHRRVLGDAFALKMTLELWARASIAMCLVNAFHSTKCSQTKSCLFWFSLSYLNSR